MKAGEESTLPQCNEIVDPEGSCKKDNSKAECNCFVGLSENEIIFLKDNNFDLKCQCKKDDYKGVFSIDELTITDVSDIDNWDDYAIDEMWEERVAYYLPEHGIWRLWFREDAWD